MVEEEGMTFLSAFAETFASKDNMAKRLQAERRANMTPAQRNRRGPPKVQINFRATAETKAQLDALVQHTGMTATEILERAIAAFAQTTLPKGGAR